MTIKSKKKEVLPFHPILFGLYPVLTLYVINRSETVPAALQKALITSVAVTAVVIAVSYLVFRSWRRAAAPATLTLLLFFSYGHVNDLTQNVRLFGEIVGRGRTLLPIWLLLFILGLVLLSRSRKPILDKILNTISLFLMIFLVVQFTLPLIQLRHSGVTSKEPVASVQSEASSNAVNRDVYYILVDAYSRQDVLQEQLGLDTSNFTAELKKLGFYIPDCAQSNYDNTLRSMTATLNMNYLDAMGLGYFDDKPKYEPYLQNNLVMRQFKELGYRLATFKSLYPLLDFPNGTYYYDYYKDASVLNEQASLNFQYLFLKTTLARPLMDYLERNRGIRISPALAAWIAVGNSAESREHRQYLQNVFALDALEKLPDQPGKKFVYAHLYITHQPYVFNRDGSFNPSLQQGGAGYREQIRFADMRLIGIIKTILAKSKPAPIIVLQSDHSYFENADRVKILNAYYLPEDGGKQLYATVTPVNTFRIIFNEYFGGQYNLLPDVSVYSDQENALHHPPMSCVGAS
ncbi:MAG: hypothetical protein ACM3XO_19235 [Bacteroidota bacterium]